jgi:hypothetical protein
VGLPEKQRRRTSSPRGHLLARTGCHVSGRRRSPAAEADFSCQARFRPILGKTPIPTLKASTLTMSKRGLMACQSKYERESMPCGGEGGIRTHGTVTRTTVFEFYDSHAGPCRSVGKRAAWFGILTTIISSCDVPYRFVTRSWFAIWFANFPPARVRLPRQSGHHKAGSQKTVIHKANTQKRCSPPEAVVA